MPKPYICKDCSLTNNILNKSCYCGKTRDFTISESIHRAALRDIYGVLSYRNGLEERREFIPTMDNEKRMELHTKFFAQGYSDCEGKTIDEIIAEEEELEEIVVTAKAALHGKGQARREKEANLSKEERDRLRAKGLDVTVSDAINGPKLRKDRMSKADKLAEILAGVMNDDDVKSTMANLQVTPIVKEGDKNLGRESRANDEGRKFTFQGKTKAEWDKVKDEPEPQPEVANSKPEEGSLEPKPKPSSFNPFAKK